MARMSHLCLYDNNNINNLYFVKKYTFGFFSILKDSTLHADSEVLRPELMVLSGNEDQRRKHL